MISLLLQSPTVIHVLLWDDLFVVKQPRGEENYFFGMDSFRLCRFHENFFVSPRPFHGRPQKYLKRIQNVYCLPRLFRQRQKI